MKKEKDQVPERGRKEKQNGQSKSKQGLSWKPYLNKVVEWWKGRGAVHRLAFRFQRKRNPRSGAAQQQ